MSGFFDDALARGEIAPAESKAAATRRAELASRPPSLREVLAEVLHEVERAEAKHRPMNSSHEGWAVILEEVDELWEHVRAQTEARSISAMRKECIQIAAMAVRFIRDVCDGGNRES